MSKWNMYLAAFLSVVLLAAGCQQSISHSEAAEDSSAHFPAFLVGTWKAETSPWQVTLGPGGTVVSAVGSNGIPMPIAEGRTHQAGSLPGEFIYMEFGSCSANYDPKRRNLSVDINVDLINIHAAAGELDMYMQYHLKGPVFEDNRRWRATWWYMSGTPEGARLDPNEITYDVLLFNKL